MSNAAKIHPREEDPFIFIIEKSLAEAKSEGANILRTDDRLVITVLHPNDLNEDSWGISIYLPEGDVGKNTQKWEYRYYPNLKDALYHAENIVALGWHCNLDKRNGRESSDHLPIPDDKKLDFNSHEEVYCNGNYVSRDIKISALGIKNSILENSKIVSYEKLMKRFKDDNLGIF